VGSFSSGRRGIGGGDKDRKPMRVGSLERDKPTFLLTETPEHRPLEPPQVSWAEVYGRRGDFGPVVAGGERTLEG
jgi:hypothetical protein